MKMGESQTIKANEMYGKIVREPNVEGMINTTRKKNQILILDSNFSQRLNLKAYECLKS